jgi:hypothetical protein
MDDTIPMEIVVGPDETTVWLFTDRPDPLTVRFEPRMWARIELRAKQEWDGDIQQYISELVIEDFEAHGWPS